ncbi:MAG: hypothetical protein QOE70_1961 [Chthoniobacter sp.]|jgi:uncharacterized protein YidB (DUF937 family)|nr:hypothetical protein [Chthoniobacter sp.]
MSFFSELASSALGALNQNTTASGQSAVSHVLSELIQNHGSGNGLAGLVQQLAASGLGPQVQSWVGTGANLPVSADQIQQALGSEKIQQLAQQVGLNPADLSGALAHLLPHAVDHLTPDGQMPSAGGLPSALSGLLSSGLFKR